MIPDTTTTPAFIQIEPDWGKPVVVRSKWRNAVIANREGGEQRLNGQQAPKMSLSYFRSAHRPAQFALERGRQMSQLGKAVVLPVWTFYLSSASFATNSVTVSASITSLKYKVGSWIYVVQGANKAFRKITSVAGAVINLSAAGGDIFPVGFSWASFSGAGARVYPCILGTRTGANSYSFRFQMPDRSSTQIGVEEL